jgi:hypothetical protein
MGAGGDATGVFVNGFGMGAGGTISVLSINGFGVGAPRIRGVAIAGGVIGTPEARGLMVAGAWNRVRNDDDDDDFDRQGRRSRRSSSFTDARFEGVGISAFNQILGTQKGLTIGLVNYAWTLHGVQLGLINIVRENPPARRVLPIVNWGSGR